MPRRARLMLAGMPVHITHRGNNRQRCFYEDCDRAFYLFHLRRLVRNTDCALHAYCLMSNHVHLLLTPRTRDSCARLMKGVAQIHTQYINRTYNRSGSLWEGRFHSCLVQSDAYLLECYRYVERNPVAAKLCDHPCDFDWSSARTNAQGLRDAAITPHEQYLLLGKTAHARRSVYAELLGVPLADKTLEEIRSATNGNFALGDDRFKRQASGRHCPTPVPGHAQTDLFDR